MEIRFNPRENGACPVCRKHEACMVRQKLSAAVSAVTDAQRHGLELVIYTCPQFVETA
jgi:hypothetical protein